jgi:Protein of unknown function (DUF2865)
MRRKSLIVIPAAILLASGVAAQTPNPACQHLVAQLTALDRGNSDPARAAQIRRAEDQVNRQQFEIDRQVAQARRMGCERSGFFSIFSNPPPQCGALNRKIDLQRNTLDQMQNNLERLQGGTAERAAERQSLLLSLADNGCGPQYRSAALSGQQGGFFDRLFGNNGGVASPPPGEEGQPGQPTQPMGGTYRTICVRTCDGYYFPISFETTPDHFNQDEQTCQRMCPAADVSLYTYHNPGETVSQAVSLNGRLYTELPTAFQYRKALNQSCSCRRPGESWYEALKGTGPDETVVPGDVIVTDKTAKNLSQPRIGADGKPIKPAAAQKTTAPTGSEPALAEAPGRIDPTKRKVRTVGPTFLPSH